MPHPVLERVADDCCCHAAYPLLRDLHHLLVYGEVGSDLAVLLDELGDVGDPQVVVLGHEDVVDVLAFDDYKEVG
jgi:hypothetical protein